MRKTLFESFTHGPLTEVSPAPGDDALAELAAAVRRFERHPRGSAYTRLPAITDSTAARAVGTHGARCRQQYRSLAAGDSRSSLQLQMCACRQSGLTEARKKPGAPLFRPLLRG